MFKEEYVYGNKSKVREMLEENIIEMVSKTNSKSN
jgi:hypothetical protein